MAPSQNLHEVVSSTLNKEVDINMLLLLLLLAVQSLADRSYELPSDSLLLCEPGELVTLRVVSDFASGEVWHFSGPESGPAECLSSPTGSFEASGLPQVSAHQVFLLHCLPSAQSGDIYPFLLVSRIGWEAEATGSLQKTLLVV